jgi:hypothetical protein
MLVSRESFRESLVSMAKESRKERLMPGGIPRWVRCYDNGGETIDRYTVVFTRNHPNKPPGLYIGASTYPFHPQGFGQHGHNPDGAIDRPTSSHLGKRVKFEALPPDVQQFARDTYSAIWNLAIDN